MISRRKFLHLISIAFLSSTSLFITGCNQSKVANSPLSAGSKVVALGDSLTFGYGVGGSEHGADYPSQLAKLTSWNITNAGVNGDTSQEVLDRLDKVLKSKPKLVLLGIGGNDVLQKISSSTTKKNINLIIMKLKSEGIPVVLIAQPHFSLGAIFGKASDNPIYEEIAEQQNIPLYEDKWSEILSDDKLKSDQIHANEKGYKEFAEGIYDYLKKIGYTN